MTMPDDFGIPPELPAQIQGAWRSAEPILANMTHGYVNLIYEAGMGPAGLEWRATGGPGWLAGGRASRL